jgi:predicted phage terminase large subunit-like protein
MMIDDAVHEGNVGNPEQLQLTIKRFIFMRSILEPYGYMHVIGTPYSDADLYQWLEEDNNGDWLRKFRRPAWTMVDPNFPDGRRITDKDVVLLFPERFSFKFLNSIRNSDQYIFDCQYLLDPTPKDKITFTDALLESHHIPHFHIPKFGSVFQAWDIGFKEKKRNDFTVGATGLFDTKGNLFVLDLVIGRFNPYVLIQQIAAASLKWRPQRVAIEDAGGTQLMRPALDNLEKQFARSFNIEWIPTSPLKQKPERILSLQPLLIQNKLYFSTAILADMWEEAKKQFTRYPRGIHDDAPDAISMLLQFRNRVDYIPDLTGHEDNELLSIGFNSDEDNLLGAGICG